MTKQDLCSSLAYFPLVGLVLGAMMAALDWAISDIWEPALRGMALTVFLAFVTRGLHLDGLCDVADAIGSRAERHKALEIMRDSRIGSLGALALVSLLMLKGASLSALSKASFWQFLIITPCLSRWSLNCLSSMSIYARDTEGLGKAFCGKQTRSSLVLACLTSVVSSWFLLGVRGLYLFVLSVGLALLSASFFRTRFGGVTGDCLGAHLETVETLLFVAGAGLCR